MRDVLGLYISVPFCRAKCTFCNFASDAFALTQLEPYLAALSREISGAHRRAEAMGARMSSEVDTIYFGGGTPSLLASDQIRRLFARLRGEFAIAPDAEITVECAPGQLAEASLDAFVHEGVNRLSFGVQSFVDEETRSVGRSHTAEACLREIARARSIGLNDISLDLIAGLPGQMEGSWQRSIAAVVESGVPHASVYMLEVDEDSRLGREVLRSGSRYGAATVPGDDQCVDFYETACDVFDEAGLAQYEISNFARAGSRSRHNVKYWRRQPYLGFGLDAHSMLPLADEDALRFANGDLLDGYLDAHAERSRLTLEEAASPLKLFTRTPGAERVAAGQALEEALFLGLRMNEGVDLRELRAQFGAAAVAGMADAIATAIEDGLLEEAPTAFTQETIRLTRRGRPLANEVFARLLAPAQSAAQSAV